MISRRDFHKGMAALALSSLAASKAWAQESSDVFYLNRLTFGADAKTRKDFTRLGLVNWLDAELKKPLSDPGLEQRLARATLHISYESGQSDSGETWEGLDEMRPYMFIGAQPDNILDLLDFDLPIDFTERERPGDEVVAASFLRATHADAQLREVMTAFWHEHFSANSNKDVEIGVYFADYDALMRKHAFGNFRALLGDVAKSPSMLNYLNNSTSRASPANENYARELLELHTMGAVNYLNDQYRDWKDVPQENGMPVGYIDQDVYEVARAFTGWTVGDGRWIDDGKDAPRTAKFHYADTWHDPYQKRILAQEFGPNRGPMQDGEDVLDILAAHPATARFVTSKILRRLGIENPSAEYSAEIAQVFLAHVESPDQIAQVIRAIVLSDEYSQTPAEKLRRPFEYLIALFRATGTQVESPQYDLHWALERVGWTQHRVAAPTGHSDHSIDWANTRVINGMVDFALYGVDGMFDETTFEPAPKGINTWGEMVKHWVEHLSAPRETVDAYLTAFEVDFDETLPFDDPDYLRWASTNAIGMAALSSGFIFR